VEVAEATSIGKKKNKKKGKSDARQQEAVFERAEEHPS
jgi:hypothetical protein